MRRAVLAIVLVGIVASEPPPSRRYLPAKGQLPKTTLSQPTSPLLPPNDESKETIVPQITQNRYRLPGNIPSIVNNLPETVRYFEQAYTSANPVDTLPSVQYKRPVQLPVRLAGINGPVSYFGGGNRLVANNFVPFGQPSFGSAGFVPVYFRDGQVENATAVVNQDGVRNLVFNQANLEQTSQDGDSRKNLDQNGIINQSNLLSSGNANFRAFPPITLNVQGNPKILRTNIVLASRNNPNRGNVLIRDGRTNNNNEGIVGTRFGQVSPVPNQWPNLYVEAVQGPISLRQGTGIPIVPNQFGVLRPSSVQTSSLDQKNVLVKSNNFGSSGNIELSNQANGASAGFSNFNNIPSNGKRPVLATRQNIDATETNPTPPVPIILYENEHNGDGTYRYRYVTGNGIEAQEQGDLKVVDQKLVPEVRGSYSYLGPDGMTYSVTYVADQNGFQPVGDHLPTPPPIPQEILESLQKNTVEEANLAEQELVSRSNSGYEKK